MKTNRLLWLLLILFAAAASGSALARDRHHGGHRHSHSHWGVYIGIPLAYPWYGVPSPYYYPGYYPGPVIVRPETQTYIERADTQPAPDQQFYWYYCDNPQGYYPYVKQCPAGWQRVVPTPPAN